MGPELSFQIVTPALNQGRFIASAVHSVLAQEGPFHIDYTVRDGGSTDGTVDVLREIEAMVRDDRYPVRCRGVRFAWESSPDGGQYAAILEAFRNRAGEVMGWLNSDDILLPGALAALAAVFMRHADIEWVGGDHTRMNADGVITDSTHRRLFPRALIRRGLCDGLNLPFIQQESTYWRRSLWERAGAALRTDLGWAADFELWMRFAGSAELVKLHAPIGAFRVHGRQKTARPEDYLGEVTALRSVSAADVLVSALRRRLWQFSGSDLFALFPHSAEVVYYSHDRSDWVRRRVMGAHRRR
jgi:glycosyltransferase involved in cell wall biosynthesis